MMSGVTWQETRQALPGDVCGPSEKQSRTKHKLCQKTVDYELLHLYTKLIMYEFIMRTMHNVYLK